MDSEKNFLLETFRLLTKTPLTTGKYGCEELTNTLEDWDNSSINYQNILKETSVVKTIRLSEMMDGREK